MTVSRLIFVEQRPMAGRVLPIEAGLTIGREGTDIVLPDPEVSRKHAVMRVLESGGAAVEDLGSTNGTYVNDERIDGADAHRRRRHRPIRQHAVARRGPRRHHPGRRSALGHLTGTLRVRLGSRLQ